MRRKTLINNLIACFPIDRFAAAEVMEAAGIGAQARAEELSIEAFCILSDHISEVLRKK